MRRFWATGVMSTAVDCDGEVRRQGTARPGVGAAAEDTADLELKW